MRLQVIRGLGYPIKIYFLFFIKRATHFVYQVIGVYVILVSTCL